MNFAMNPEAEWYILYGMMAAGKKSRTIQNKFEQMLKDLPGETPFEKFKPIVAKGRLRQFLEKYRIGKYDLLCRGIPEALELKDFSFESLMSVPGIGRKSASVVDLYVADGSRVPLDVHILRFLREEVKPDCPVPKSTPPSGCLYDKLEAAFLKEAKRRGMTPADLDREVWTRYSGDSWD